MKHLAFSLVVALAACGGKQTSGPSPSAPAPVADPVPAEPAPAEPAAPAEEAKAPMPVPDPKAELLAAETAAYEKAKPVFEKWCAKCHTKGAKNASAKKLKELDITTYPFAGEHASAKEIREVLAIGGGRATMPADKKGAVKGDELAAIAAWADAWDASHAGGAHDGHGGHDH